MLSNSHKTLPRVKETDVNSFFRLRDQFFTPDGVIIEASLREDGVDRDFFGLSGLPAGAFFETETLSNALDTVLGRFDSQGTVIETDDDSGQGLLSRLTGIVPNDGVLNFAVSGYPDFDFDGENDFSGGPHGSSGAYELVVRPTILPTVTETDVNSFFSVREPISTPRGVIIEASLREDGVDRDFFSLSGLPAGAFFEAETLNDALDTVLGRFDSQGTLIETDDDSGRGLLSRLTGIVPNDGVLNLAVSGFPDFDFDGEGDFSGGPHGQSGNYKLVVSSTVFPDDIPSDTTTTATLQVGGTETSTIDFPADEDWFLTSLDASKRYTFMLVPDENSSSPLSDPYFRLYDAGGTLIAADDDGGEGLNSKLEFEPETGGTYYASAGGFGRTIGGYSLSLEESAQPFPGPILIDNVPAYNWYHGCAPTAAGMVFGYWDQHGFPNAFDVDSFDEVLLTANVQDHISSPAHNAKYDPTPDDPTLPEPTPTGIADFMGTSVDPLQFGYTWVSNIAGGFRGYADFRGYSFESLTEFNQDDGSPGGSLWDKYVAEIDGGRPTQLTVDIDGDGAIEHCVTGIGYEDRGGDGLWYAMFTTWSESETVLWRQFQPTSVQEPWSVGFLTSIRPEFALVQVSGMVDQDMPLESGPQVGSIMELGSDPLDVIAGALASDGMFDDVDAKIYKQAKNIDFFGNGGDSMRTGERNLAAERGNLVQTADFFAGEQGSYGEEFTVSNPDDLLA
jgi:hypothetical protein